MSRIHSRFALNRSFKHEIQTVKAKREPKKYDVNGICIISVELKFLESTKLFLVFNEVEVEADVVKDFVYNTLRSFY